ncbi:hypothetical protein ACFFQF_25455 [Haladaptatus pallidirubidus]|uniref:Uncharacterized protein n=1 Tax=Haladaptatus pallidirubidus TaxID=1008152 RepID=A0AAV3UH07_9EURY|nr:hypothetical protein [Haladaptatus pallidirubidus]
MRIRRLRATEFVSFVDDLLLPFAREMAILDEFDTLADRGVRANVFSYVEDRHSGDDTVTFVAADGDELVGHVTVEKRASPRCSSAARGDTSAPCMSFEVAGKA